MDETDDTLMVKAAWLYHVGGLNQAETAERLGLTRARVNRLLADALEEGVVSITVDRQLAGMVPVEEALRRRFGLDFCQATPALDLGLGRQSAPDAGDRAGLSPAQKVAFRAVGLLGANHLRAHLARDEPATVGLGWGRTLEQMTLHMAGVSAPNARFISLMGSLTANSAFNPFELVHTLAKRTGGEGYFLPVPFIADTVEDKQVLLSQRQVAKALAIAGTATLCMISVGELEEGALLRRQGMLTVADLESLHKAGAVGDTNGIFFDALGRPVDHPLNERTLAVPFDVLRGLNVVLMVASPEKTRAAAALLASGIVNGLIIDGDAALRLVEQG
ncbi:sugar-binding transcriptional regulator [Ancylobacter sp. SL191]|uniref:sugar-binding transcriptional regulator n=1 Tax=Ancylobacter sp. SL191 TaxID=2995166 RepID=UPI00226D95BD|nr:sugar-binding domain-containing protein [Ancylobacter sp. SL191]WAC27608.1 sugar-binding transcriptional regulator [Ancylobacter sp. SL191]